MCIIYVFRVSVLPIWSVLYLKHWEFLRVLQMLWDCVHVVPGFEVRDVTISVASNINLVFSEFHIV